MKIPYALAFAALFLNPIFVSADDSCVEAPAPVIPVADLDANGVVDSKDIVVLAKAMGKKKGVYSNLYYRNHDGEIDASDKFLAARDMGKTSTAAEQALAKISIQILAGTYECPENVEEAGDAVPATGWSFSL